MSNRRIPTAGGRYRSGFLKSTAWLARRDRWFREHTRAHGAVACELCDGIGDARSLELHHLDYTGVDRTSRGWRSRERDEDLMPLHPACHETLHRLIDRDTVLSRQRTRRDATMIALAQLRSVTSEEVQDA